VSKQDGTQKLTLSKVFYKTYEHEQNDPMEDELDKLTKKSFYQQVYSYSKKPVHGDPLTEEFKNYTTYIYHPDEFESPIDFFYKTKSVFPILYHVASAIFSVPCSSVPSEAVFSLLSRIQTKGRSRLSPEYLYKLAFLNYNKSN
jgi:hypothetical protein